MLTLTYCFTNPTSEITGNYMHHTCSYTHTYEDMHVHASKYKEMNIFMILCIPPPSPTPPHCFIYRNLQKYHEDIKKIAFNFQTHSLSPTHTHTLSKKKPTHFLSLLQTHFLSLLLTHILSLLHPCLACTSTHEQSK